MLNRIYACVKKCSDNRMHPGKRFVYVFHGVFTRGEAHARNNDMGSVWWPNAAKTIACEALCEPALLKPLFLKLRRLNRLSELTPAVVSYI